MYSVSFEMKVDYSDIMMEVETWIKKDGCGYGGHLVKTVTWRLVTIGLECCLAARIA